MSSPPGVGTTASEQREDEVMATKRRLDPIVLFLTIITAMTMSSALTAGEPLKFLDRDGDGISDLEPDFDFDRIPDPAERHGLLTAPAGPDQLAPIFARVAGERGARGTGRLVQGFGRREFAARAMSQTRSDFDAWFGSGPGVTSGASSGGACAGGVCR